MNERQPNPLETVANILSIVAHGLLPPQTQPPDRLPTLDELPMSMVPPPAPPAPPVVKNPELRASQEIVPLLYE